MLGAGDHECYQRPWSSVRDATTVSSHGHPCVGGCCAYTSLSPIIMYVSMYIEAPPTRMSQSITATRARQDFFKLIERAQRPGQHTVVTIDGQARVVLLSAEEYEGWIETLEILDDQALVRQIGRGLKDRASKRVSSLAAVRRSLGV